ncbi:MULTISPECIES: cob(I)yrinic acid a,c-diamide adenosyltransferase [unclassified Methylophaga]|mgnify:FL=1|jgi:cob(I)alamin adenosyltransferase|uniref:cob(I)yrinic acid a,c-diamide adenosyltransferase n=1 Tax=unclassified Methylophaga TaxID=2629249 RepID=UPI000C48972A|nr:MULTISPECIES: cob(I)yrinic acid a,c-diamide adenosyltransferase [unclassified Methylophaga]MAL49005.1 cob(I)yrinic acid a,c-diamide adenosyltransferase [Methylophaga sp.]MAP25367.1 cob(I)yrinic acid a,c-diamide adenosyltransferase [Methylophaga sp.]MBP25275.1 cob(I)yrinic acid a,c-diamide adenosyltransferase [Methylophaga sp.]MDX1750633.1 cob(I)yrinic acid a,c-diamide adenosyltransferase [Methylophaga sp.]HAD31785.1 cob(I)yrinic acid a,c-diamide adenosyltransferase [Methylophaga sp.]|tara:strand:- start:10508 stop:11116 length:609 start_codon:yes stop_codon:yes gene_type:complete
MTDSEKSQRHKDRMQRHKEVVDQKIQKATKDKGLLLCITGNGKGKSSSGFGMIARALGHDMKVGIVQFIKGAMSTGEEAFYRRFPEQVSYHVVGDGFTWDTQNLEQDKASAEAGWDIVKTMLQDDSINVVLLDELNIVLKMKYLDADKVIADLAARPAMQHVIITGRGAPDSIIEAADTVSRIEDVKHAFRDGIRAQKGIEL